MALRICIPENSNSIMEGKTRVYTCAVVRVGVDQRLGTVRPTKCDAAHRLGSPRRRKYCAAVRAGPPSSLHPLLDAFFAVDVLSARRHDWVPSGPALLAHRTLQGGQ